MRKLTTDEFIQRARLVHGTKYDYSKVEYKSAKSNVDIICPIHGVFPQSPYAHTKLKQGCPHCANRAKKTIVQFIADARKVHGNKYDYSKVEYVNNKTKVKIICPKHGVFEQTPHNHVDSKQGCKACFDESRGQSRLLSKEEFIQKAIAKHGNKYDYSKIDYKGTHVDVCIICPEHGEFWQQPANHLQGNGCKGCADRELSANKRLTTEEFIRRSKIIHNNKYDYFQVKYVDYTTKVKIICPIHGIFEQAPQEHLAHKGCKQCGLIQTIETKKKNNSFHTSQPEENLYKLLVDKFGVDDVFRQYRDEQRYPFNCDFYIKSLDLFIELNASWLHQGHFYDETNEEDINHYHELLEKYPAWGWETWTYRDPLKKKTAEENNLNYKVFWDNDLSDAKAWLNTI